MRKINHQETLDKSGLTPQEFKDLYLVCEWSLVDFKREKGIPYKQTQRVLDFLGVEKRGIGDSKKTKRAKSKTQKTLKSKYGCDVENISQIPEIQKRKEETLKKNYGVDNIFKDKEFKANLHQKMLDKYGAKSVPNLHGNANPFGIKNLSQEEKKQRLEKAREAAQKNWEQLTDEQKNEIIAKRCKGLVANYNSSLEVKVEQGLKNLEIKAEPQFWLKRRSYDFLLKGRKIIIEVQGDFWHANPELYEATDILNFPSGKVLAQDIWSKDLNKRRVAESYGNRVIYVWEREIDGLSQPEIMELLIKKIYEDH